MDRDNRGLWITLGVLLAIGLLGPMVGGGMMTGPGMMGRAVAPGLIGLWPWWLAMGVGWLSMIAIVGAVIIGGLLAVRALSKTGSAPAQQEDEPLVILQRRLARGEITQGEFDQVRQALEHEKVHV